MIAEDRAERPEQVQPLPNLDCLIRQGDSLFEPVGDGLRLRPVEVGLARDLSEARRQVVVAVGRDKRAQIRGSRSSRCARPALPSSAAEAELDDSIEDLLRQGRGDDLFGNRRGLDRTARLRLAELRRRATHDTPRTPHASRASGKCPGSTTSVTSPTCSREAASTSSWGILPGSAPRSCRPTCVVGSPEGTAGGGQRGRGYANRPDLAVAFLERALELAAPDGHVAYLVPAKLATAEYGAAARHALAASSTLIHVANLSGRPEAAFDATVYPLAIVLRKSAPKAGHRVRTDLGGKTASVNQSRLGGGGPWILAREPLLAVLASLSELHPTLGSVVRCHLGLKTGANRVFLNPPPDIEPEVLRQAIRGRDIRGFRVTSRTRLLYTHSPAGSVRGTLPARASRYLRSHGDTLRARADFDGGPVWTLFRVGPAVARHRVIWPDLARDLLAAALTGPGDEALVPLNSCYVAPMPSALAAACLAAWLNSTWMRAAARAKAVPAASGFARFTAGTVERLPLPSGALSDPHLAALADAGRRGEQVQSDLDALVARHLDLGPGARSALLGSAGRRTTNRR